MCETSGETRIQRQETRDGTRNETEATRARQRTKVVNAGTVRNKRARWKGAGAYQLPGEGEQSAPMSGSTKRRTGEDSKKRTDKESGGYDDDEQGVIVGVVGAVGAVGAAGVLGEAVAMLSDVPKGP